MKRYSVEWFIKKFEKIPPSLWTTGSFRVHLKDRVLCCALGHCGHGTGRPVPMEALCLMAIFAEAGLSVPRVNDDYSPDAQRKTPKGRILYVLRKIRDKK